jgi:putative membrane protein
VNEVPLNIGRGFLMGAADVVPGVSGGTVALVLGIYRRLVASIKAGSSGLGALVRFDPASIRRHATAVEWRLVIPLIVGIGLAVLLLAGIIERQRDDRPVQMAALFLGLVGGSIVVAWRLLERRDGLRLAILAAVGVGVFVVLGLREGTSEDAVGQLANPAMWAFFAAGAIAIWAMILPGISGSFILVILGMYGPVLSAVNAREFGVLGVFVAGTVIGLALFSQVLHWLLATHYDSVMAGLIGLMLGSLRVLWPWPNGVDSTALGAPRGFILVSIVLALAAFAVVVVINEVAMRHERRTARLALEAPTTP